VNTRNIELTYAFRNTEVLIRQVSPIQESLIDRAVAVHDELLSIITELHDEKFCVVAETTFLSRLISAPSYSLIAEDIFPFDEQKGKIQSSLVHNQSDSQE
jgi:hypothetical protein